MYDDGLSSAVLMRLWMHFSMMGDKTVITSALIYAVRSCSKSTTEAAFSSISSGYNDQPKELMATFAKDILRVPIAHLSLLLELLSELYSLAQCFSAPKSRAFVTAVHHCTDLWTSMVNVLEQLPSSGLEAPESLARDIPAVIIGLIARCLHDCLGDRGTYQELVALWLGRNFFQTMDKILLHCLDLPDFPGAFIFVLAYVFRELSSNVSRTIFSIDQSTLSRNATISRCYSSPRCLSVAPPILNIRHNVLGTP